jgi:hypothetical protein
LDFADRGVVGVLAVVGVDVIQHGLLFFGNHSVQMNTKGAASSGKIGHTSPGRTR